MCGTEEVEDRSSYCWYQSKRLYFCRKIKNRRRENLTHQSNTVQSNDG